MIPNLFSKEKIPDSIPEEMQKVVDELKNQKNKEECLRKAFDILSKKYKGRRYYTITGFFKLFELDLNKIWKKKSYLHCTTMNYLLRTLLVKSGFFEDKDIKLKLTSIRFISLHQYLNIKINENKSIDADLWAKTHGIELGDYAHGFH